MKGAYVHCRIASGGALNVLKDLIIEDIKIHHYDKQPKIFTIYSSIDKLDILEKRYEVKTALPRRANKLFNYFGEHHIKGLSSLFDYRNLMPIYPLLMNILSKKIQKEQPNHILISSFAVAKNINQAKKTSKIQNPECKISLYLHSPMQYIRSHHLEYTGKLTGFKGRLFRNITNHLRKRDVKFTHYDTIRANSQYTAEEAKKRYGITAEVKYPKLNPVFLEEHTIEEPDNYFVCVGRLVRFVREVDVIIHLFNKTKERLLLIGSGPDELYLKSIAGDSIIFLGQLSAEETVKILKKSRGLINLTKESFGLGTAEALCLGVPVFGYNQGATPELVDKDSGVLVDNKTLPHLIEKFDDFTNISRKRKRISEKAKQKFH